MWFRNAFTVPRAYVYEYERTCVPEQIFMFRKYILYYESNLILYWKHLRDYNFRIRIIICVPIVHITFALASRHCVVMFMHIRQPSVHTYIHKNTSMNEKWCTQHGDAWILDLRWNFVKQMSFNIYIYNVLQLTQVLTLKNAILLLIVSEIQ